MAELAASQKGVGGVKEKGLKKKSLLPCQPTVLSRDATLESEQREERERERTELLPAEPPRQLAS